MQTIVIGHRNPDMDSICSALAYARLKQLLGVPDVIAARAGNTNARINYVLEKFNVEPPIFLSDVSPRVSDVMERNVISVRADSAIYDAVLLIENKQLRGLPVTDENNRCLGLLSSSKISHHLFPPREEAASARLIFASVANIVETFGGKVLVGEVPTQPTEQVLMIGAMNAETFSQRLHRHHAEKVLVIVGDRDDIQMRAIESNVRAIIITGGLPVLGTIKRAAKEAGVTIISSPHDSATTVLLARGAVRADHMIGAEFTKFDPDTLLEVARQKASTLHAYLFPIIDEDGTLVGVLSKSDFLKPVPRRLILVDHNELNQAVPGADKIPIVEILDHHRIGGFTSDSPIHFWNNPVGSTSTIVALCYQQMGVAIPSDIAGLLMAGLISDTLNLSSPTATQVDKQILEHLSKIAKTDPTKLAKEIFAVGSPLLTMTPKQVITADCKEYGEGEKRFTVSQIEELSFSHLPEKQAALLEALDRHCKNKDLFFAALLVTDINTQNSLLLVCGDPGFLQRIKFPSPGSHVWELPGVVSRKKQLLPYLLQCLSGAQSS